MTQPKPASARDPAQEDNTPAAPAGAAAAVHAAEGRRAAFSRPRSRAANRRPAPSNPRSPSSSPRRERPRQVRKRPPQRPQPPAAETRRSSSSASAASAGSSCLSSFRSSRSRSALRWWLSSGRYVSTDNAYVGADKSLITPQVTGAIVAVHVVEGQKVKVGDPLFDIDPKPYEIALALAKGKLEAAKIEFANLKSSYLSNVDQIKMGEDAVQRAPGRLRPQERPRHLALGHGRRSRHLDGHSHSGQADPRIRQCSRRR